MSDPTAQEPTMEEILASIRRIISEDDAPAAAHEEPAEEHAPPPQPERAPEPEHHEPEPVAAAPAPHEEEDDDVLELTDPAPEPTETHGDLDVFAPEPPPPPPPPEPIHVEPVFEEPHTPSLHTDEDRLVSGGTEDRAASHFGLLSQTILMPDHGRTLEDVVRELLRPLLTDWLDRHLPAIVEEKVQAEVERIARRRV
jgi:cell pole-organizing protein PopZ